MVGTGLSDFCVGVYKSNGGNPTYSNGIVLKGATNIDLNPEKTDDNDFYADNAVAETDSGRFKGGSVTLELGGLEDAAERLIFGLPDPRDENYGDGKTIKVTAYGDGANPPYMGIGFVQRIKHNGADAYTPYIIAKVKFELPDFSMQTSEESISWQKQGLEAKMMRDDSPSHEWLLRSAEPLPNKEDAVEWLRYKLGITAAAEPAEAAKSGEEGTNG